MSRLKGGVPTTRVAQWVAGAPGKHTYPWQGPHVRTDLSVQVNTRQPEKLMIQVEYLAAEVGVTKRQFIELALKEKVQQELKNRGMPE